MTLRGDIAILDTCHVHESLTDWGTDKTSSTRGRDQSYSDRATLSSNLAGNRMGKATFTTPVTTSHRAEIEFSSCNGTTDTRSYLWDEKKRGTRNQWTKERTWGCISKNPNNIPHLHTLNPTPNDHRNHPRQQKTWNGYADQQSFAFEQAWFSWPHLAISYPSEGDQWSQLLSPARNRGKSLQSK